MNSFAKILSAAGFLSLAALAAPAANAGVWHLDARACPDLREDRRDARYDEGRWDRREDRRDRRVIECPRRAWEYVPSRYERRHGLEFGTGARRGTPGIVYRTRGGEFYRVNRRGQEIFLDVVIHGERWARGGRGYRDGRRYRDGRGYRDDRGYRGGRRHYDRPHRGRH